MTVQHSIHVCSEYILIPVLKSFLFKMNSHIKPWSGVKAYLKHLVVCFCCDCETRWWRAGIGDTEGNEKGKKSGKSLFFFGTWEALDGFAMLPLKNDIVLRLRGACPKVAWSSKTIPLKSQEIYVLLACSFLSLFLVALGLCCHARACSSCEEWGLLSR